MKTHCLNCNGRQGTRGTGRIDYIQRAKHDLAWVVWKCQKCALVWTTPILSEDDAGTAIAEHILAIAGIAPQGQKRYNDEYIPSARRIDHKASWQNDKLRPMGECACGLPRHICTIDGHGPNLGAERVA